MSTASSCSGSARPQIEGVSLFIVVLLPFAAGYCLSYVLRTINALIAQPLVAEIGLSSANLGLLTSLYFLVMAVAQLPLGALLDRYGPRRIQCLCLLIAAIGAAVFANAQGLPTLLLGRALIGLGFSAALMSGLKAIVLWFPPERIASANGLLVTLGALGAVTATAPGEALVDALGWRGLFLLLAGLTIASAAVIFMIVPERRHRRAAPSGAPTITIGGIYSDRRFWRLAPISAACIGTSWAVQGLWAAPWLTEVEGFDRPTVVRHLLVMALALSFSAIALGSLADRLRRRGVTTEALFGATVVVFMLAQLAVILRWPIPSFLSWALIAMAGAATVLSYAILPGYFPKEASGRANGALNLLHLGVAFGVQWLIGVIIDLWPSQQGHHPVDAYRTAFALNLVAQAIAFMWFVLPQLDGLAIRFGDRIPPVLHAYQARLVVNSYRQAHLTWLAEVELARSQAASWRSVALASIAVCVALTTLAIPNLPALSGVEPSLAPTTREVVVLSLSTAHRSNDGVMAEGHMLEEKERARLKSLPISGIARSFCSPNTARGEG